MLRFYNMGAGKRFFQQKNRTIVFIFKGAKMKRSCKKTVIAAAVFVFCAANAAEQKSLSDFAIEQGTDVLIKNQVEGKSLKEISKEKKAAAKQGVQERVDTLKSEHGLDKGAESTETKMPSKAEIKDEINTRTKAAKKEIGTKALESANEKTGGAARVGVDVYKAVKDAKKTQ